MKNTKVWILTSEYNEYDQMGEYFIAVFGEKPSLEKLANTLKEEENIQFKNILEGIAFLHHLLNSGGRRGTEDKWYNLNEVELQ